MMICTRKIDFSCRKKAKAFFWLTGLSTYAIQTSAQSYYPGGLGNANLIVWMNANKASSITENGANQVSQWSDLSGNSYNFTQATTANEPVYGATTGPNNRPALTFTSTSSQYLSTPTLPASLSFTGGVSTFTVSSFNAPQTAQGWQRIYDFGDGQGSNNVMLGRYGSSANFYYESWNGGAGDQTWTTTNPIVNGSDNVYEAVQRGGTVGNLTAVAHYLAGTSQADGGAAGSSETWVPTSVARTSNYIGRSNWAADNYFSGTMSEILLYNTAFNTTQRIILENYLSAEWDEAISISTYTPPTASTYGTNLVGIGYTSAADNFLTNPAGSTDGLGFSSGSGATGFLNTAGYITAAHNGQANTVISNATIPGIGSSSPLSEWNRSWNFQKMGGNGTGLVTLNFNFSDYNGTTPSGTYTYSLLYNATNGSFATGTNQLITTTSTTVSGNIVSFTASASNLSNGYYTIIYSTTPIVLPVILTDFEAQKQQNNSLLTWNTASKTSVSYYAVERSTDGAHFTTIGIVYANADSTVPGQYTFTDSKPSDDINYYRLAMVDPDGTINYSNIALVDFDNTTLAALTIYPNPTADIVHISLLNASTTQMAVRVFDMRGRVVIAFRSSAPSGTADIPVSNLAQGIYVMEIDANGTRYTRKMMKY